MASKLEEIIAHFNIPGKIQSIRQLGDGFINDTFIVSTVDPVDNDYLLQRKNKHVFRLIPEMMANIEKVTVHLKRKILATGGDPEREALTLVKTITGDLYYQDKEGEYWTLCIFISDCVVYDKADTLELARSGGKGVGKFQSTLADFDEELADILPGFHDMGFRFGQWDKVLEEDTLGRKKQVTEEISWIESRRKEVNDFWMMVENGTIPKRISHNDTKISNILFDSEGEVLCMIDLDTVKNSMVLNDFGDAIRSYANTGKEDDQNLENVSMDIEVFRAFTEGYISEARTFLSAPEIEYLAFSACLITYEQVLRFLMDYIDGDNYYKTDFADHNLSRARAQYKLLQSMEEQLPEMRKIVSDIFSGAEYK